MVSWGAENATLHGVLLSRKAGIMNAACNYRALYWALKSAATKIQFPGTHLPARDERSYFVIACKWALWKNARRIIVDARRAIRVEQCRMIWMGRGLSDDKIWEVTKITISQYYYILLQWHFSTVSRTGPLKLLLIYFGLSSTTSYYVAHMLVNTPR